MKLLLFYIGFCVIGYFTGSYFRKTGKKMKAVGKLQMILLFGLLFTMGARLFANDRVLNSLGQIGISAFIMTVLAMTGSLAAVLITRKVLKYNRKGVRRND